MGMNTYALLSSIPTVQAAPAHTRVWPVLVITTVVLAAVIAGLGRLRPSDRAIYWLVVGFVVLGISGFGVVFPALMPARDQLDAIARDGGEEILAFIVVTSTVGVAVCLHFCAQILRVLVTPIVRTLLRRRRADSAGAWVEPSLAAAVGHGRQP